MLSKKLGDFFQKLVIKLPALCYDILAIPVAWTLAYWLRFNLRAFPQAAYSSAAIESLMTVIGVQIACYYYFKVYRGLWRYASMNDVIRIIKSVFATSILVIPLLYLGSLLHQVPRSVLPLYFMILVTTLCGGRLAIRSYYDGFGTRSRDRNCLKVLIVGAGFAGESLVRDLNRHHDYLPVAFVDDNPGKWGQEIHGVRVEGTLADIPALVRKLGVDLLFIAIPSIRSASMRRIVSLCEQSKIPFRTLPAIKALASGLVTVNSLRPVRIEDLLGRDEVNLDWEKIIASIAGKRIMITGGGGSIGSELCRQIMKLNPLETLVVDNSEFNLYQIERELRSRFSDQKMRFKLVNITDSVAVKQAMIEFEPELVFHAAAYKHVPLLENQIRAAVLNNIIGTQLVAQASVEVGVEKFILISSDKAVNPTNVMGTTKRVAEIYCQNLNKITPTQFITVRFGNVLGSAGSVLPLFQEQLKAGGPLTVTHPDMKRYFMTIPEACQLILQAMVNGMGGEIFVLDMGEPVKIKYLAEQMIRLSGKEPGKDIAIEYTGLRPGEKLFEELFHESEQLVATEHVKLFKARFREINWDELSHALRLLQNACASHRENELIDQLKNLVPEFQMEALQEIN